MNRCKHKKTAIHIFRVYEIAGKSRDYPMNDIELCDACGAELWAQIKDSVAALHMHYEINMHYEIKPIINKTHSGASHLSKKRKLFAQF
jgi:hypothetical protein